MISDTRPRTFILEDEAHKDRGYNNPPRTAIKEVLAHHNLTIALTPEEAKAKWDYKAGYGLVLLDHDMEGWPHPNLNYANCGLRFVEWLVIQPMPIPQPRFYIHTQNRGAIKAMAKLLVTSGYKSVIEMPYNQLYINHLKTNFAPRRG